MFRDHVKSSTSPKKKNTFVKGGGGGGLAAMSYIFVLEGGVGGLEINDKSFLFSETLNF